MTDIKLNDVLDLIRRYDPFCIEELVDRFFDLQNKKVRREKMPTAQHILDERQFNQISRYLQSLDGSELTAIDLRRCIAIDFLLEERINATPAVLEIESARKEIQSASAQLEKTKAYIAQAAEGVLEEAYFDLAIAAYGKDKPYASIKLFYEAIENEAEPNPHTHYNLGLVMHVKDNFLGALTQYSRKALPQKRTYKALNNLGVLYIQLKDFAEAKKCLESAIELEPNGQEAIFNLALCCKEAEDNLEAISYFMRLSKLKPDLKGIFSGFMAKMYFELGKYEQARFCGLEFAKYHKKKLEEDVKDE